jgi:1,2-diacylglycerol 3-alpha-glucosyltransferase
MRIAMFTDSWLPGRDGCVSSILKFREGLEKRGHEIFIFAPEDPSGKVQEDEHTFLFKAKEFPQYPQYRMAMSLSSRKDRLLRENDIQMIHSHGVAFMGFKAMMSSRVLKLPVLMHFHTWVTEVAQYYPFNLDTDFLNTLIWIYLKPLFRRSDGVAAPSKSAIEELETMIPGMTYTDWVFPGIDTEIFNPNVKGDAIREKHGLLGKEVILHVGRVSSEKNLELVIDSMKILEKTRPDARLLVVGDGPARQSYQTLVRDKGLEDRVIFAGFVADDLLPEYYAACDTFVLASKFETLGIVMTEALATGKPVAGVNHRVIPHIISDGENGHLFEDKPSDCAEKIIACLDAPDEMRKKAVESVSMFDKIKSIDKLETIYRKTEDVHESRMKQQGIPYARVT